MSERALDEIGGGVFFCLPPFPGQCGVIRVIDGHLLCQSIVSFCGDVECFV